MTISPLQKCSLGKLGTKSSDAVISENGPRAPALELSSDAAAHLLTAPVPANLQWAETKAE